MSDETYYVKPWSHKYFWPGSNQYAYDALIRRNSNAGAFDKATQLLANAFAQTLLSAKSASDKALADSLVEVKRVFERKLLLLQV